MLEQIIGQNIRGLRLRQNMTIETLSFLSGLDPSHIGKIERGKHNATIATIDKIAQALGINLSELFNLNTADHPDYDMLDAFIRNNFPPRYQFGCYDPLLTLDYFGQVILDKLTLLDIEKGAYGKNWGKHEVIKEQLFSPILGHYTAYGIKATYQDFSETIIHDIGSLNFVKKIVSACNTYPFDKSQLENIIEDFLQTPLSDS